MKIQLTVQEILIWHDSPQLFVAKDSIGGIYPCLAVETEDGQPFFLAVAISPERFQALKFAGIDLFTVFAKPEMGTWFQIKSYSDTQAFAEPMQELNEVPAHWLPVPGEFLPTMPGEASLIRPESFEAVKVSAVAKEAGMNATLLRQYVSGVKRPSPEQARRVQDALHKVANRLLEVRFV